MLLTRPALVAGGAATSGRSDAGDTKTVPVGGGGVDVPVSNAVMSAAIRVLTDDRELLDREVASTFGSRRPDGAAVALAWNGPLVGPVLRRAARLAHRVVVVVSAGMRATELTKVTTRLGRKDGVGYVLVNLDPHFAELSDRVGPVEIFWQS